MECLLRRTLDKNSVPQSEIILNEIAKCIKCISHENLCRRHTNAIETILINEVQYKINELKTIDYSKISK